MDKERSAGKCTEDELRDYLSGVTLEVRPGTVVVERAHDACIHTVRSVIGEREMLSGQLGCSVHGGRGGDLVFRKDWGLGGPVHLRRRYVHEPAVAATLAHGL